MRIPFTSQTLSGLYINETGAIAQQLIMTREEEKVERETGKQALRIVQNEIFACLLGDELQLM